MDEARFKQIISRQANGLGPVFMRGFLRGASWLYGSAVRARLALYGTGVRCRHKASVPVICVGNLTVGGTGKTPFVALVCERLKAMGKHPAILSRGYGGNGKENDEAKVLAELLPDVPHVQNPDRVAGAAECVKRGGDVIVMDDGFSHLRLARELDILLFDATCPFGYDALLPRGLLREPLSSAKRAKLAVITRSDTASALELAKIEARLRGLGFAPESILRAEHAPTSLEVWENSFIGQKALSQGLDVIKGKNIAMLCGIGNPDVFAQTLARLGARVVEPCILADHFAYDEHWLADEWPHFVGRASHAGAEAIVVTQKDAVKLRGRLRASTSPVYELRVAMKLTNGAAALDAALQKAVMANLS